MTVPHDLRLALRALRHRPGFAAVAITTLALAIGATTAVFSLVWGVALQPLDLPQPERVTWVGEDRTARGGEPDEVSGISTYRDWRQGSGSFAALGASFNMTDERLAVITAEEPEAVVGGIVSADYFAALGVAPAMGREFRREEEVEGADDVVLLSDRLWRWAFGADPAIIGSAVTVEGVPRTVVGVLPPGFRDPLVPEGEIWIPLAQAAGDDDYGAQYVRVVGFLAPGVDPRQAAAELAAVTASLGEEQPEAYERVGVSVTPLQEVLLEDIRTPSLALFGAVLLVLAIACVNLANLLLAHGAERERELAVRAAIGAGRERLVRQLLTESLALALLGGLVALPVGWVLLRLLVRLAPANTPRLAEVGLHGPVFLFALVVTLAVGVLFGLLPAWRASRAQLSGTLRQGNRASGGSGDGLRRGLIVGEIALSLALLVGAGLLVRSLLALGDVDAGFATDGLLATEVKLPTARYEDGADIHAAVDGLLERLDGHPAVAAAAASSVLPLTDTYHGIGFQVEGEPPPPEGEDSVLLQIVTTAYFETLDIPLLAGRAFGVEDHPEAPRAMVVNEAFARRYLPAGDPLLRRVRVGGGDGWWNVVGVTGSVQYGGLTAEPEPLVYLAHAQHSASARDLQVVLRVEGDPAALVPFVQATVRELDPQLPLMRVRTGAEMVGSQLAMPRFLALLLASFAAIAVLLAVVGIYGVMAFLVNRRRREIGVRMALGARPREVLALVLRQGLVLAGLGVVLGAAGAVALSRGLASLLFEVRPSDPATLAGAGLVLIAAALAACLVPALRASRVDPVTSLRQE